ncbi:MAG: OmpA family protein, partial [Bdellovibrionales bacterium]|nr:OmpA family protein [Bdellovibrionales bacterium]
FNIFACSGTTPRDLKSLRARYTIARSDQALSEYASSVLKEAHKTLQQAERVAATAQTDRVPELMLLAHKQIDDAYQIASNQMYQELQERRQSALEAGAYRQALEKQSATIVTFNEFTAQKTNDFNLNETPILLEIPSTELFKEHSAEIQETALSGIQKIVRLAQTKPEIEITIEDHTNEHEITKQDQKLSTQRASTLLQTLRSLGLLKNRIEYKAHGNRFPITENNTALGKIENNRVELYFRQKALL